MNTDAHGYGERAGAERGAPGWAGARTQDPALQSLSVDRLVSSVFIRVHPWFLLGLIVAAMPLGLLAAKASDPRDLPPVDRVSGPPPGTVVFASPDPAKFFCGSPSILILADGSYLVSHDIGGQHDRAGRTLIQQSRDRGATWRQIAELRDQKWSTLFAHRGALYLIGTSARGGNMIIRRSTDAGATWTDPTDARTLGNRSVMA